MLPKSKRSKVSQNESKKSNDRAAIESDTEGENGPDGVDGAIEEDEEEDDDGDSNVTPREAGQINRIYVENFMCHRKFGERFDYMASFSCSCQS